LLYQNLDLKINQDRRWVDSDGVRLTFIHTKNRREGFFGVVERPIAIIEYSNPIPKLWVLLNNNEVSRKKETGGRTYLWIWEQVKGLLVGGVSFLQVVLHQVAVT
jgi:hypothetical protein